MLRIAIFHNPKTMNIEYVLKENNFFFVKVYRKTSFVMIFSWFLYRYNYLL